MDFSNDENFTRKEEIANSVLHGIGFLIGIPAIIILIIAAVKHGTVWHIISFSIYGATLLFLYLASSLFHASRNKKIKDKLEILDHSAVFLLIAGTTTPFALIVVQGALGWVIFGLEWFFTVVGIIFKPYFVKKMVILNTVIYIAMGWLIAIAIVKVFTTLPFYSIFLLVLGGVIYTAGTVFYIWRKVLYHHAIWHFFVLAGSVCHYFCILNYLLPLRVL